LSIVGQGCWIPAFAGMTVGRSTPGKLAGGVLALGVPEVLTRSIPKILTGRASCRARPRRIRAQHGLRYSWAVSLPLSNTVARNSKRRCDGSGDVVVDVIVGLDGDGDVAVNAVTRKHNIYKSVAFHSTTATFTSPSPSRSTSTTTSTLTTTKDTSLLVWNDLSSVTPRASRLTSSSPGLQWH
jgi:hypothetical protein